jgi:phosphoglycolate phosphatase
LNLGSFSKEDFIQSFRMKLELVIKQSNTLFRGVEPFLEIVKSNRIQIAIATSKPTHLAKLVVNNSPLLKYVDFVQGTDNFPSKPNAEVIFRCLNFFDTRNALMFGDRVEDIHAAQSANIPAIGIAQGAHKEIQLLDAGAYLTFDNFESIFANYSQILQLEP